MSSSEITSSTAESGRDTEEFLKDVGDLVRDTIVDLKPRLRGWLHATTAPLALISLVGILALADPSPERTGAAVFLTTSVLTFTTSALLHTRSWSPRVEMAWRRADHATIFVLIAGSHTPFVLTILGPSDANRLLILVWGGALLGALFKVFWIGAPRWLSVGLYAALGSVVLLYVPEFVHSGPRDVLLLLAAGGAFYAVGALVYGFRWPNPAPAYFGFHEVFHALTIGVFTAHCLGVGLLVAASRPRGPAVVDARSQTGLSREGGARTRDPGIMSPLL